MNLISPPEAHYTVYQLTAPNGLIYIGCTGKPVEERWHKGSKYSRNTPIRRAIDEFGWDAFEKKILCEKLTKEGVEKLEKWFIAYYDSSDPEKGYNRMLGGLGKGQRACEYTRKLNRESTLASYSRDPTYQKRLTEATRKLWKDPDYRARTIQAQRAASCPELSGKSSRITRAYYQAHPERSDEIRAWMREYLSNPENQAFVHASPKPKPVRCRETGEVFPSQRAAEKAIGFSGVHKACSGHQRTCGGYHWEYCRCG